MVDLTPIENAAKTQAAATEAKTVSWLKSHWYSFGIGVACGLLVSYVAHKL
jgi:hypothetical protein